MRESARVFTRAVLVVLGGGRSSRFGSSKLCVEWQGEPILAWQSRLKEWADELPLLARAARREAWINLPEGMNEVPGVEKYDRIIRDRVAYAGPLAGICAALDAAEDGDLLAVVPADMPLIRCRHLAHLAASMRGESIAAMGRWSDTARIEPLPSIWNAARAREFVRDALARGQGPSSLANHADVITAPLESPRDTEAWCSINSPEDYAKLRQIRRE